MINRFFSEILYNDEAEKKSVYQEDLDILQQQIDTKNARIAEMSEKLDEANRLAETRLARIRRLELSAPKKGEPVPSVAEPKTNGGRLRAMTDGELAKFLNATQNVFDVSCDSEESWFDWLGSDTL